MLNDWFTLDFQWACWNIKKCMGSDLIDYFDRSYAASDSFFNTFIKPALSEADNEQSKRSYIKTKMKFKNNTQIISFNGLRRQCGKTAISADICVSNPKSFIVTKTLQQSKYLQRSFCVNKDSVFSENQCRSPTFGCGQLYNGIKCILLDEIDDDFLIDTLANLCPDFIISMKT